MKAVLPAATRLAAQAGLFACLGLCTVLVQSPVLALPAAPTAAQAGEASHPVDPRVARGRIGVGLNWPGLGLRALIGNRWMAEAKGQYEKEARAYGGRLYFYVFPESRIYPYLGAEGDYVQYLGEGLNAGGYLGEVFAGVEYFIWKRMSLQFDFGPAYVGLEQGGASVSGIRFVVNFGLTVYF